MKRGVLYGTVLLFKRPNVLVNWETSRHTYTLHIYRYSVLRNTDWKKVCFDPKGYTEML